MMNDFDAFRLQEITLAGGRILAITDEQTPTALRATELRHRLESARGELSMAWDILDAQLEAAEAAGHGLQRHRIAQRHMDTALALIERAQKELT